MTKPQSRRSKIHSGYPNIVRTYGVSGPLVIVLHGGPGAPGNAASIARGLADTFRVVEPWQRGGGRETLTVSRHVDDLHDLAGMLSKGTPPASMDESVSFEFQAMDRYSPPALAGESWGAMLALAYAAAHPDNAGPLVLLGCGTFNPPSRARMREILEGRMNETLRRDIERLEAEYPDHGERLRKHYELIRPLYDFDPLHEDLEETAPFDFRAHIETWSDMVHLQDEGVYPAAFVAIKSPVLMLHGDYDPHPGQMIRTSLEGYIPHLEYREFKNCGHSPWRERQVKNEFFAVIKEWLMEKFSLGSAL